MKAIHNAVLVVTSIVLIVSNMSKILNESNSQQSKSVLSVWTYCFQYVKDTK